MRLTILLSRIQVRRFSDRMPQALRSVKGKSNRNTVQYYIDSCRVRAVGGRGGDGCISFLSLWCKEHAGPDGGDGGHGGHVIFEASHSVKSLNHCASIIQAKNGEKGYTQDCNGKNAQHVVIPVPIGTIIRDEYNKVIGDLNTEGTLFVAARGGAGGRGNKFFVTDTEQSPDIAEYGAVGESNRYTLEMRSMAHIGLIGFPNAGKSTLLRAITRARPKVAPYPFTTLHPHIGMVPYDDYEQVAVADLPGLIPGSHRNYGLGIQFLQHAERCCGFLFLIDASLSDPWEHYESLLYEMGKFNPKLLQRSRCIVANKMDLSDSESNIEKIVGMYSDSDVKVLPISAKCGHNLKSLLMVIRQMYDQTKPAESDSCL